MPKYAQEGIQGRQVEQDVSKRSAYTEVVARPVDMYVAPADNDMMRLADSLAKVSPALGQYAAQERNAGITARELGKEQPLDVFGLQQKGWMEMDGVLKSNEDSVALRQQYMTEFNKDSSSLPQLDQWLKQKQEALLQGMPDANFRRAYEETMGKEMQGLRGDFLQYSAKKLVDQTEALVTQGVYTVAKNLVSEGKPVTAEALDTFREHLKQNKMDGKSNSGPLNIKSERLNELVFTGIKNFGDEGNPFIYEALKKDRPDGTPGMYFIPGMKEKIDAAEVHANHVMLTKNTQAREQAKAERADKADIATGQILALVHEGKPAEAKALFDAQMKDGSFSGRGSLISTTMDTWTKFAKKEATEGQQLLQTQLLKKIYERSATQEDILKAALVPSQQQALLASLHQVKAEDRTAGLAAQALDQKPPILKDWRFTSLDKSISSSLKSHPSVTDPLGMGTPAQQAIRANAEVEFTQGAIRLNDPEKLQAFHDTIIEKAAKAYKAVEADPNRPLWLRYSNPTELMAAKTAGTVDLSTFNSHVQFFKANNIKK